MKLDQTDQWMFSKVMENKKRNIYYAYSEYILCLKDSLRYCGSASEIFRIKKEIKKLEKQQQYFFVPSLLEKGDPTTVSSSRISSILKKVKSIK